MDAHPYSHAGAVGHYTHATLIPALPVAMGHKPKEREACAGFAESPSPHLLLFQVQRGPFR